MGEDDQNAWYGILKELIKTRKKKRERVVVASVLRCPASGSCGTIDGSPDPLCG